jgi:hypothetical protein
MGPFLGAAIDVLHALLMAAWVLGLPLLFWHRYPRLTRDYAVYAIAFIVLNQASQALLGECFLTTLARAAWQSTPGSGAGASPDEWFTVRLAQKVFDMTPSHRSIKLVSEALILVTAIGVAFRSVVARRLSRPTRALRKAVP